MRLFLLLLLLAPAAWADTLLLNPSDPKQAAVGELTFKGAVTIPAGKKEVGGLSALWVADEGDRIILLSDLGHVFEGELKWDKKGNLAGVAIDSDWKLKDISGGFPKKRFDTEALLRQKNGSWLVGIERDHRIWRYGDLKATPTALPNPEGIEKLPRNLGLESLVRLEDGKALAIAEAAESESKHAAWLWNGKTWATLDYQAESGFMPSDAALLPDGDVLVLERSFNLFSFGFAARMVRVKTADIRAGASIRGKEIARFAKPLLVDNFEGLYARRLKSGETQLFMVSDNNFNVLQESILEVFVLSHSSEKALTPG